MRIRPRMFVLPLIALAVGILFWQTAEPAGAAPACTWRVGRGVDFVQGANYDTLPAESPLRLSVVCPGPRYVYVFSHSQEDGTLLLFPSTGLKTDLTNPLPEGRSVLPGQNGGDAIYWTSRARIAAITTFIAVASEEPIAELDALLPRLRSWTNSVFPDGSMAVTQPAESADFLGKPRAPIPNGLLQKVAELSLEATLTNGPMTAIPGRTGIWGASWRIKEKAGTAPKQAKQNGVPTPTVPNPESLIPKTAPANPKPAGGKK